MNGGETSAPPQRVLSPPSDTRERGDNEIRSSRQEMTPRHKKGLLVVAGCCVVLGALGVALEIRHAQRIRDAVIEIRWFGGYVYPAPLMRDQPSMLGQLKAWWDTAAHFKTRQTVHFYDDPCVDSAWLRSQDYLSALSISKLELDCSAVQADDVSRLIEQHSPEKLFVEHLRNADEIVDALAADPHIKELYICESDLADAGLQQLPLEQLTHLGISGTQVTADGLRELRRGIRIRLLRIDGQQFNGTGTEVVRSLPVLSTLELNGASVTDEHLQPLHGFDQLKVVDLINTSVTAGGYNELSRASSDQIVCIAPWEEELAPWEGESDDEEID